MLERIKWTTNDQFEDRLNKTLFSRKKHSVLPSSISYGMWEVQALYPFQYFTG